VGIRITTLSENTATMNRCLAEWGLSFFVETDEARILFDTGMSVSASHNADILGIDLKEVDKIILSHGHFDHTGGLRGVLSRIKRRGVEIIAHPDIWQAKYHHRENTENIEDRYIGIPFAREELESLGGVFNLGTEAEKITGDMVTTGEIPMITAYEHIDSDMYLKVSGEWQPDALRDDKAIIINTEMGLVVILGCAHRGIINTLYYARQLTGVNRIHMVIGGAHLISASEEQLWLTIAALKELDVERLGLCHCTGLAATSILAQEFGDRFFFNNTGTRISVP